LKRTGRVADQFGCFPGAGRGNGAAHPNLVADMSHVHGELLETRVWRRSIKRRQVHGQASWTASQEWKTFLRNHAPDIAAMDLFVVPTIGFKTAVWLCDRAASSQIDLVVRHPIVEVDGKGVLKDRQVLV